MPGKTREYAVLRGATTNYTPHQLVFKYAPQRVNPALEIGGANSLFIPFPDIIALVAG